MKVSFLVTDEMVAAGGFSIQLNAYDPPGNALNIDWMQYVFLVSGSILAQVQYWDSASACACPDTVCDCAPPVVNDQAVVAFVMPTVLPGTNFEIALVYATGPSGVTSSAIAGAIFTVTDGQGNLIGRQPILLDSSHQFSARAFQVNIVGPDNASTSTFSKGAGTITYEVSPGHQLCVQGGYPDVCGGTGLVTAEQSNATYGPISPSCCGSTLTQSVTHN